MKERTGNKLEEPILGEHMGTYSSRKPYSDCGLAIPDVQWFVPRRAVPRSTLETYKSL